MALVVKDRVRETSTTTGTGTFTLAGAVAGFQSFTAIGTGNTTYYTIVMSGDWEVGLGTWTSPDQLSRDTVLASSNAGALVPFGSGTKDVFCTFPAEGFASPPAIGGTTPNTITGTTVTANTQFTMPTVTPGNVGTAVLEMIDDGTGGGYDLLNIYTWDGILANPVVFPGGLKVGGGSIEVGGGVTTYSGFTAAGNGTSSGSITIYEDDNVNRVVLTVPTTLSTNYTLTLPSTSGSANQVLKTDGTGVTSWTTVDPLTLTGISDPSAPSGTNTTVYSKSFGGYPTLAGRNALNSSFGLQSALWSKNIQMWTTTTATAGSWLNASGTGNGTYTNVNPTAGATKYQTVRRSTYANVITTTNQTLGVLGGQASFFRGSVAGQGGYFFYARCGFDVWTNGGRFFAGMSQAATVVTANATGTNNTAGFAVEDTDAGAISFVTRSGTTATKTPVGLTITSNKGYDCYIYCSPNDSQISWQIIDINTGTSVTGTANTNLPVNTFMVNPMVLASNAALTPATSISLGVAKIYIESDY
jgi:hypothetical protein